MISARTRLSVAALIAIAAAAPALAGPAYLKFGGVKGESTDDKHKGQIEILSWSWGEAGADDTLLTAGPMSGAASSDPQEGGEVASEPGKLEVPNLKARTKPKISEIPVVKRSDQSSPVIFSSGPQEGGEAAGKLPSARDAASGLATGKRVHKPIAMTQGSVTVTMPEGVCVAGSHYPAVTLTDGDQAYEMQGVTIASCTPVATAKAKKDKAKLDYMVVKMETVLVSG